MATKTAVMRARISAANKEGAERVLRELGLSFPDVIRALCHQIVLTGKIPFSLDVPDSPSTDEESSND